MSIDERVLEALAAKTRFGLVRHLQSTGSTNTVAAEEASRGAPEGLVVVADYQSAGRGRRERSWLSAPGQALLASVLLRPDPRRRARWGLLGVAAALAAQGALLDLVGLETQLKWPNDLLVGQAKLAGVLAEAGPDWVVVGMGLNLTGAPPGAACLASCAEGPPPGRDQLLGAWLEGLEGMLYDFDGILAAYRQRCKTLGATVRVILEDRVIEEALAEDLDQDGRLLVRHQGGVVALSAADVVHLRTPEGGLVA